MARIEIAPLGVVDVPGVQANQAQGDWVLGIEHGGGEVLASFHALGLNHDTVVIGALSCGAEVSG